MVNKISLFLKQNKRIVIICGLIATLIIVVLAVILTNSINNTDENSSAKKAPEEGLPKYSYTYVSSDISCSKQNAAGSSLTEINYCSGNLSVKPDSGEKTVSYKLTSSTHFYNNNGTELSLDALNKLVANKSKLSITFASNKEPSNIFSQDQIN